MRVVGIDAGYVNFAVCAVNTEDIYRPYYWKNEPLFTGEFSEERLCQAIHEWTSQPEIREMLDAADVIVLERQMTMKFQAVNHCIRFRWWDKTQEVNPKTFAAFFNFPQTRKEKKKAAVDMVSANTIFPVKKGKKDDLADAYLLALFHIFSTQAFLKEGWKNGFDGPAPALSSKGVVTGKKRSNTSGTGGRDTKRATAPTFPSPASAAFLRPYGAPDAYGSIFEWS